MRVVEPKKFDHKNQAKKRNKIRISKKLTLMLVVALSAGYMLTAKSENTKNFAQSDDTSGELRQNETTTDSDTVNELNEKSGLRQFTGNEFRIFYDNLLQANLDKVDAPPSISGNDAADARIRHLAEARGYRLRSNPSVTLVSVDGYLLQSSVKESWEDLQATAAYEGLTINIVSAFRSVETQRALFLNRLNAQGVNIQDVAEGVADEAINKVLVTSSIPGYSKHHTGYTIDLQCAGFAFDNFANSPCNVWLTANNYENAKKYGFIPSYPSDADLQGPDPEAWEYVWVGVDILSYN